MRQKSLSCVEDNRGRRMEILWCCRLPSSARLQLFGALGKLGGGWGGMFRLGLFFVNFDFCGQELLAIVVRASLKVLH